MDEVWTSFLSHKILEKLNKMLLEAEETVWDISGCICERMVAIRSDWENEDKPEEEDYPEEDDPEEEDNPEDDDDTDPDVCCPATADVTVWEIRGCICDTTDDTMSDWRLDDELPDEEPTVLEEIPEDEIPDEEPNVPDDVPNKLEEIPDEELPDVPVAELDPGLNPVPLIEELGTWVLTGFVAISTNPSCTSLFSEYPIGPAV